MTLVRSLVAGPLQASTSIPKRQLGTEGVHVYGLWANQDAR